MHWFDRWMHPGQNVYTQGYQDETIEEATFWIMSVAASGLSLVAVVTVVRLATLEGMVGAIVGFNGVGAMCLYWLTDARRVEVFAGLAV